jgi:uncharacterized protein (DUF1684 family)
MKLNALHMRFGAIAAGIILLVLGARAFFPSAKSYVSIEFGADPDTFAGAPVEIDGQAVGKLERTGQATRIAFPVDKGEHTIRVVHPNFECAVTRFAARGSGDKLHMLLDVQDSVDATGRMKPTLMLRQ